MLNSATLQDHREHAIDPAEARAAHAVSVAVLGAPELAEHLLGLNHASQNVLLHVVGDACLGKAFEHARVGVPRPGTGGESFRDFKRRIYRHGISGGLTAISRASGRQLALSPD